MSIDINLVHPLRVSQLAIEHFLSSTCPASKQNTKSIIHVVSISSELGLMPTPLYSTAKWGCAVSYIAWVSSRNATSELQGLPQPLSEHRYGSNMKTRGFGLVRVVRYRKTGSLLKEVAEVVCSTKVALRKSVS